ncbi:MAG: YiiX/YebB-like N1pC/P60 family cysteine hydrolase [Bacteroidales bacterium]|jgi:hypothetical protein|nr:YiiX/YebB-like N1pC/P60 family cysteine hydrolase [Bacteroidales bacterium]
MFTRISVLLIVLLVSSVHCQSQDDFKLEAGHILFQDLDAGPLCEAIEAVTQGYNGATLSHMGLVIQNNDSSFMVLEAIGAGVVQTPLQEFLQRSLDKNGCPKVLVAKVKDAYLQLIPKVLKEKDRYLDLPYK